MDISNFLTAALLNQVFRNQAYTRPAIIYVALYTSDPTKADTGQEVKGGAYARQTVAFSAPEIEGGKQTIKNSAQIQYAVATADWGLVTHVGLRDAATGGNLLYFGKLDNPRTILVGDRFTFAANSIVLTLD